MKIANRYDIDSEQKGLVVIHYADLPEIQVHRFWSEVREKYDTRELIGPEGLGRKIGIGLIRIGESGISTKALR